MSGREAREEEEMWWRVDERNSGEERRCNSSEHNLAVFHLYGSDRVYEGLRVCRRFVSSRLVSLPRTPEIVALQQHSVSLSASSYLSVYSNSFPGCEWGRVDFLCPPLRVIALSL